MNMVTKNDQITAIEALSLAVNTPDRMPPRMMTMVPRPHSASAASLSACRSGTTSPRGYPSRRAVYTHRAASVRPSNRPGTTPAMNSAAILTEPPAAIE